MSDSVPPYAYRCVDRSILVGSYRTYVAPPFAAIVPLWMPANFVTLGSSLCMWVLLGCATQRDHFSPGSLALVFAALIQVYLVYDHVDGMQAKRTGTSSALGEYLDHSLDVYHAAISTLAIFALIGFEHRLLVLVMLWCGHVAFAATLVEEKERGELYFGPVGSLEGVLLFTGFFISWTVPAIRAWWLAPLVAGWPAYWILIVAGAAGSVLATVDCLRRIGRVPRSFALFVVTSLLLTLLLARSPLAFWPAAAALVLYCGDYTGRVLGSHLLNRPHAWPDWVALPLLGLAHFFPAHTANLLFALLGYLVARTAVGIVDVLHPLRQHWRWVNLR